MGDLIMIIIIVGLCVLALWLYFKFFKLYKVKNIVFVDGSLGTGKSFFSVSLAVRLYKKELFKYKVKKFVLGALGCLSPKYRERLSSLEEPVLYSNIRLRKVKFTRLTADLILRKNYRFAYKSVLLIDEFSLMADQFLFKDRDTSERLSNFFKLWRHETHGGYVVINSQSTSDLHYSIKYVLSDYLYIHHKTRAPFVSILKVQEMVYCADKDGAHIVNARNDDVETNLRMMFVFNKYFKYYDSYCYSIFTDGLPVWNEPEFNEPGTNIKMPDIVSFKQYRYLTENIKGGKPKK